MRQVEISNEQVNAYTVFTNYQCQVTFDKSSLKNYELEQGKLRKGLAKLGKVRLGQVRLD